jgi:hypothetical protein
MFALTKQQCKKSGRHHFASHVHSPGGTKMMPIEPI